MESYWKDYQSLKLETWINEFKLEEINVDKIQEYLEFVKESAQNYDPGKYSENHHIIPRCSDRNNKFKSECLRINGSDHFTAHLKLVECFKSCNFKYKLSYALIKMFGHVKDIKPEEYEEAIRLNSIALKNREVKESTRKILSEQKKGNPSNSGRIWITNGTLNRMIPSGSLIPDGWSRGHTSFARAREARSQILKKSRYSSRGMIWINNGHYNKRVNPDVEIPKGWLKGMLRDRHD